MAEIKSKVITPEFAEGFDRTFGRPAGGEQRKGGRFIYRPGHPQANERGFVAAHLVEDARPVGIQINTDQAYNHLRTAEGIPLTSRRAHRDYMKANNLTVMDDFKGTWGEAAARRAAVAQAAEYDVNDRREDIRRAVYEVRKP